VRVKIDAASTVTAGNASGQNDGAAMCVVTTREEAERRGLRPLLSLKSWAVAGVGPEVMGIGPVPATAAALDRADLTLGQVDVIELNEAFAAQVLACLREWKVDPTDDRLNPNGSGISLGHPVGATGARILATLAHEMHRREARYGLETMCIGGGHPRSAARPRPNDRRSTTRSIAGRVIRTGPIRSNRAGSPRKASRLVPDRPFGRRFTSLHPRRACVWKSCCFGSTTSTT
jgi:acetyl-CoA C-acetyltransferase